MFKSFSKKKEFPASQEVQPLDLSINKSAIRTSTTIPDVWLPHLPPLPPLMRITSDTNQTTAGELPETHFDHLYETAVLVLTDFQEKRRKRSVCEEDQHSGGVRQRQADKTKCQVCKRFFETESLQEHMEIVHKYLDIERQQMSPTPATVIGQHAATPSSPGTQSEDQTDELKILDETTGLLLVEEKPSLNHLNPCQTKSSPENNLSIKIRLLEDGGAQIIEVDQYSISLFIILSQVSAEFFFYHSVLFPGRQLQ